MSELCDVGHISQEQFFLHRHISNLFMKVPPHVECIQCESAPLLLQRVVFRCFDSLNYFWGATETNNIHTCQYCSATVNAHCSCHPFPKQGK